MKRETNSTRNSKTIDASPKEIYRALTDPKALIKWQVPGDMTAKMHYYDLKIGGGYEMSLYYPSSFKNAIGKTSAKEDRYVAKFVELIPNKKIVQTTYFITDDPEFKGEMSTEINIEPQTKGTRVTFIFKNLPKGIKPEDNKAGTRSSLKKLSDYLKTNVWWGYFLIAGLEAV